MISHKTHAILLIIVVLIIISINSMACDIRELCDFQYKLSVDSQLQLTDELTEPNRIEHNSQIIVIPATELVNL
jgi:hypothetical protein